jgi:hypothetical protein
MNEIQKEQLYKCTSSDKCTHPNCQHKIQHNMTISCSRDCDHFPEHKCKPCELNTKISKQWLLMGLGVTETKLAVFDILIRYADKMPNKSISMNDLIIMRDAFKEGVAKELKKDMSDVE